MLPRMNRGDWIFWAIMTWIGVNLLWLKFIEQAVPQWVGAILATIAAVALFKYGPRPVEEEAEED